MLNGQLFYGLVSMSQGQTDLSQTIAFQVTTESFFRLLQHNALKLSATNVQPVRDLLKRQGMSVIIASILSRELIFMRVHGARVQRSVNIGGIMSTHGSGHDLNNGLLYGGVSPQLAITP